MSLKKISSFVVRNLFRDNTNLRLCCDAKKALENKGFLFQVVEVPERIRPDVNSTHIIQERDFYRARNGKNIKKEAIAKANILNLFVTVW
ncbi:hypothetical protein M1394_00540 [Candidatus Marsarchaeota archaeon]|nr:hypothetical protein [Candidatus Marsarchaeota archaeon]